MKPEWEAAKPDPLERTVSRHVCIYVLLVTWMFGGRIDWSYWPLTLWGLLGALITAKILLDPSRRKTRHFWLLLPWLLLVGQVLVSAMNPSFEVFTFYEQKSLRPVEHIPWLPSSARPAESIKHLALYSVIYLSMFNLLIAVRFRRTLRRIALFVFINGAVLAVFGTLQKLTGSDIFFGLESSPNPAFFATFIYHNHWGAYAILVATLGMGIVVHRARETRHTGLAHNPAVFLVILVFFILITLPLSSSRSSSLLGASLAGVGILYLLRRVFQATRKDPTRRYSLVSLIGLLAIAGSVAIYRTAEPVIKQRFADTVQQVKGEEHYALTESQKVFYGDARFRLYEDTLTMISDRPIFGWGLGNYGFVFMRYNTQSTPISRWPVIYMDAHSDWLEALAEVGAVGAVLLLMILLPTIWLACRGLFRRAESGFPFLGVLAVAAYAMVEFPFANPAVFLTFLLTLFFTCRLATIEMINHQRSTPTESSS